MTAANGVVAKSSCSINPRVSAAIVKADRLMLKSIDLDVGSRRLGASAFYFYVHFVVGFCMLWLIYTQFKEMQRGIQLGRQMDGWILGYKLVYSTLQRNDFGVTAAIETFYLVICVLWGSLGWDRVKELKSAGAAVGYQMWESFSFSLLVLALAVQIIWINSSITEKVFSSAISFALALLCFTRYFYLLSPGFRLWYRKFWGMRRE